MVITANTSIVDQDTEALLSGLNLFDQTHDFGLLGDVCCDANDLTLNAVVVGLGDCVELFLSTTDDVYFGSIAVEELTLKGFHCGVGKGPYTAKA